MSRRQVGVCSLIIGLVSLAWLVLPLRIADPELNQIVSLFFVWLVPLSLGAAAFLLPRRRWLRIAATLPLVLLAVAWPLLVAVSMIAGGPVFSYTTLDSLELEYSRVVAYRFSGGAASPFFVEIVQQMPLFPGIVLARDLHRAPHEYNAALRPGPANSVVVTIERTGSKSKVRNYTAEYRVRNFVYF